MQPHSMCAVALAKFYWNQPEPIVIKGDVTMQVRYQLPNGIYRMNEYRLSSIQESPDHRELKMYIMRSNGGLSCEVTVRRNSTSEGAEVVLSHSVQHASGLREVFSLMKKKISSGIHYNSLLYGNFEGEGDNDHRDKLTMYTDFKNSKGGTTRVQYTLEITSINYEKKEFVKAVEEKRPATTGNSDSWWQKKPF
jgi:hypothetical protein